MQTGEKEEEEETTTGNNKRLNCQRIEDDKDHNLSEGLSQRNLNVDQKVFVSSLWNVLIEVQQYNYD